MIYGTFGKPGAGKSCSQARFVQKNKAVLNFCNKFAKHPLLQRILKRILHPYDVIYCDDECMQDTIYFDDKTLGKWCPERNSALVITEAGVSFNNRRFATLSDDATRFFAMHRHMGCDVYWCSQSCDLDKKILQRTHRIYMCSKFLWWSILTPIKFAIDVDEQTKQLVDAYTMPRRLQWFIALLFGRVKFIFRPRWYKYFDSFVDNHKYTMEAPGTSDTEIGGSN